MSDLNSFSEFEDRVRRAVDMPNANPDFVKKLRIELMSRPMVVDSRFVFRPVWAMVFALVVVVVMGSTPDFAAAIGRFLGYVPEVGLVENTENLRILAEPVSETRDGVTVVIKSVFVYAERIELRYEVEGIAPANDGTQAEDGSTNPASFCGAVMTGDVPNKEGDARLQLPDGTLLERDSSGKYPQNAFAMNPVYEASVPVDVREMTLVLDCIPWARRGPVPENWEVSFKLVDVPDGTVVGEPVIEVHQPTSRPTETAVSPISERTAPIPEVTMTLEKVVPLDYATIFYLSMNMENKEPSLVSIMPANVYVVDSAGQKLQLMANFTWQPFEHRLGSAFEFMLMSEPANGPLTLVVEDAVAYYAPLYVDPPQATVDEMSFTFDAGAHPQDGQTWSLDNEFRIAGHHLKVMSARATTYENSTMEDFPFPSQGFEYGYDFVVETDPTTKLQVEVDIMSDAPVCGLNNRVPHVPESPSIHIIQLCKDEYPKGDIKVVIRRLSVLIENDWQATWTPPSGD